MARLPPGEGRMEHRFPEVDRIADVYWPTKKLVFEVQCSPISRDEVVQRISDYTSIGLTVVWILHTKAFGKKSPSAAEMFLQMHPTYYSNIPISGVGNIFDRLSRKTHLPISIGSPKKKDGSLYFRGDRRDRPPPKKPRVHWYKRALYSLLRKLS